MPKLKLFDQGHLTLEAINLIHRANALSAYLDGLVERSTTTEGLTFEEINAQFDQLVAALEPMVAPHNVDEYVVFPHA